MNIDPSPGWVDEFAAAAAATNRIAGIALGGSHGRGNADALSDWDFFFLVDRTELQQLFYVAPTHIVTLIPGYLAISYPSLAPEFGLKYTTFSSQVGLCDLFFIEDNAFPTPLREGNAILWEKDHRFTHLGTDASAKSRDLDIRRTHNARLAIQLIAEYIGATRSFARRRPVQTLYRIFKTLNLILGAESYDGRTINWWYSHCVADKALKVLALDESRSTIGNISLSHISNALIYLGQLCIELLKTMDPLDDSLREAIIANVSQNVATVIRSQS